ncbi:DinB family protein [Bacillus methanolicus PB1]|uniref:DinB family protein n=1 Tax=Bacillus methanolicus PB1 TaxID=997296 RepID=I3E242_BACMT|nr:DinB family protein [Bacillus methanolicus]EIJ80563.1 DinB family protein [Bacillus methanolicus PB1]
MNKNLLNYHFWATNKLLDHLGTLPEGLLSKEIPNVFPNILKTLEHLYAVESMWIQRIQGYNFSALPETTFENIPQAREAFSEVHNQYLVASNEEENKLINYQNTKGQTFCNQLWDIFIHIVNHGTYHRGNITSMLRQLGERGISTDFIVYLRESNDKGI